MSTNRDKRRSMSTAQTDQIRWVRDGAMPNRKALVLCVTEISVFVRDLETGAEEVIEHCDVVED